MLPTVTLYQASPPEKLAKDPTKPYRLGKELVIGALTDVTAFDPEDGTAVDFLLDRYPGLSNPVFEFLTTDENDSDANSTINDESSNFFIKI